VSHQQHSSTQPAAAENFLKHHQEIEQIELIIDDDD